MKTTVRQRRPVEAWLATLPLALGLPAVVCLVIGGKALWRDGAWSLIIHGIMMLVHLGAYLVTGVPIFLKFYRNPNSPIWAPVIGIPLGAALGVCAMVIVSVVLGSKLHSVLLEPQLYLLGAGYGTATAIAALRQRPIRA